MAKVSGNVKQIVKFSRVSRVSVADVEQLVVGSLPSLGGTFSNFESVNVVISDYLLLPNGSEVLLHGRLGTVHAGFESSVIS